LYAGRMQAFQYYTNAEARAELDRRNAESKNKADQKKSSPAPGAEN
jgi:hypothetical protein